MKLIHISDLHIGKRLYGYDMEDDQRHILKEITGVIKDEAPGAVLIAGDIYDRADPSAGAVRIFSDFLSMLAETGSQIFIIYGNHDSGQRIAYGSDIFDVAGIHVSKVYDGEAEKVVLSDEYGPVNIYLLPYLRSKDAAEALEGIDADKEERNVIVSHQFVTSAVIGDSEEMNVGALDNIDGTYYGAFDYAALGHIHMPQTIESGGSGVIRYSGSPLAYSFSDSDCIPKSVTAVEIKEKGSIDIREIPLTPLHRMCTLKGKFGDIMRDRELIDEHKEDYIKIILTDDSGITDAMARLQTVFANVMTLEYEYMRSAEGEVSIEETQAEGTPDEMFGALYEEQHGGSGMNDYQKEVIEKVIREIWEGSDETD